MENAQPLAWVAARLALRALVDVCPQRFFRRRCAAWKPHWGQDWL